MQALGASGGIALCSAAGPAGGGGEGVQMSEGKVLVMGASGFLGSHVVKALVAEGRAVRLLVRPTSNTSAIADLRLEQAVGDVRDAASVREAMEGCSVVYYCVVDTRSWLKDATPLEETNIEGLKSTLDAAMEIGLERFVYTSTFMTLGANPSGVATERDAFNWPERAPDYVRIRVRAEEIFMEYCRRGLPGVACNVAMTYGAEDLQPTPHGWMLGLVLRGWLPCYWDARFSVVGIRDAADAMLLAERHGRVAERYLIAESTLSLKDLFQHAMRGAGLRRPLFKAPMWLMYAGCWLAQRFAALLGRETPITVESLRLTHDPQDFDSSKARQELHWRPRPAEEAVVEAGRWFRERLRRGRR